MIRSTFAFLAGATALALGLFVATGVETASASMSYECWTYKGGDPFKMTHVTANSNQEAVSLAIVKFESLGIKGLPVKCK
jgi:hypothetical protein